MKTLLVVTSMCVVLFIGCGKKNDEKGKEIGANHNDVMIQDVNKVNADLEKMSTRDIDTSDQQSLDKISAALQESRDKISRLESRINAARRGEMTEGMSRSIGTPASNAGRATPSERMSEEHFKMKLDDLVKGLETNDPQEQLAAAKSVRELQASYPDRDYSVLIVPLMGVVKNEDVDTRLRIVAARALHNTNSERGDFAIKGVSNESHDQSVRRVCTLLTADRARRDEAARLEKELNKEVALGNAKK